MLDENELIRQSQAGGEEAFAELVKRYRQRLFFLCLQVVGDQELAEDMTQETFIRAFRHIGHFKFHSRFYTWLYRIAINACINAMRKQKTSQANRLSDLADYSETESALERKEIYEIIEKGLQTLSPEHREILTLFDLEGLSHQEISRRLNILPSTSRTRLHYARKQMRVFLDNYFK